MTRSSSNKNARPQQPIRLREKWSNAQAVIHQEHKAATTNVIKKTKGIQWPGFHPTGTQGQNDQVIKKNASNDKASIQQEHKVTTTNVIKKKTSNEQASIQREL